MEDLKQTPNPDFQSTPWPNWRWCGIVFLLSAGWLLIDAYVTARDFQPVGHDEYSYLIQARMLLTGRLWMPAHPLADFFETFHLLTRDTYASIYFPGTAMVLAIPLALQLPHWLVPLCMTALAAMLVFAITARWSNKLWGVTAAAVLLCSYSVRDLSLAALSHVAAMCAGVLLIYLWMRWREHQTMLRAIAFGVVSGWAAIVRPIDLLALAIPLAIAVLFDLRTASWKHRAKVVLMMILPALPFLALQAVLNLGTTGSWTTTPYRKYIDLYQPGSSMGSANQSTTSRPQTNLQTKLDYYDQWIIPQQKEFREAGALALLWHKRIPVIGAAALPHAWIAAFLIIGTITAFSHRRALVCVGAVVLMPLLYTLNPYFVQHYPIVIAPELAILCALGGWTITKMFQAGWRQFVEPLLAMTMLSLSVAGVVSSPPALFRTEGVTPSMAALNDFLPKAVQSPAVVLFHYEAGDYYMLDPVYNVGVAWPADAPIVRARDLGDRNIEIFRYYAEREPSRNFYLFDRGDNPLVYLGRADELWRGTTPR